MKMSKEILCPNCNAELKINWIKCKNNSKIMCDNCEELININLVDENNKKIESIEKEVDNKIKDIFEKSFRGNKNIKLKWKI